MKNKSRFFASLLLSIGFVIIFLLFFISSNWGLQWAYNYAKEKLPDEIVIDKLAGRLIGPIKVDSIAYTLADSKVVFQQVSVDWNILALLDETLHITEFAVERVDYLTKVQENTVPVAKNSVTKKKIHSNSIQLPKLILPFKIKIDNAQIKNISIQNNASPTIYIKNVDLSAYSKNNSLIINKLEIISPEGSIALNGHVIPEDNYSGEINIKWALKNTEKAHYKGQGVISGNANKLIVSHRFEGTIVAQLNGTILNPLFTPNWKMFIDVDNVSFEDWGVEDKINSFQAHIEGEGDLENYLINLSGQIADQVIDGVVNVNLDGDAINIREININSAGASLTLNGQVAEKWNLDFKSSIKHIEKFMTGMKGTVNLAGKIDGSRKKPHIKFSLQGDSLLYDDSSIKNITAKFDVDISDKKKSTAAIKVTDINIGQQKLDEVNVNAMGYLTDHTVSLYSIIDDARANVLFKGAYKNEKWTGLLAEATLQHPEMGRWQIMKPAELKIQKQTIKLSNGCWTYDAATMCGQAEWLQSQGVNGHIDLTHLPLSFFQDFFTNELKLSGTLNAKADLSFLPKTIKNKQKLLINTSIDISSGKFDYITSENEKYTVDHAGGNIRLSLNDKGAKGKLSWRLNKNNAAELDFNLSGWQYGVTTSDQVVSARMKLSAMDFDFLSLVGDGLNDVSGELIMDIGVSGTVNKPVVNGVVDFHDGQISVPQTGVTLENVSLAARSNNDGSIQIKGTAHSAGGDLNIQGLLEFDEARDRVITDLTLIDKFKNARGNIELTGDNFEIINLPEANVFVSPDLQLLVSAGRVDLVGVIVVPRAKIIPNDISGTVSVSDDVVIINQVSTPAREENNWKFYSSVRIDFGDDVTFSGFGVDGKVSGSVVEVSEPDKVTTGYGELNIKNGTYTAYGKSLELDLGRLNFIGNSITNPNINARAIKKLKNILVGVQVRGQLVSPKLTLFSEPPMEDANILSYLVVGIPIEDITENNSGVGGEDKQVMLARAASQYKLNEAFAQISSKFGMDELKLDSGETGRETSLHIGKYINPQLYLNYSIGISNAVNIFQLRYKINSKWILESESGEDTSTDLLYTYEH